MVKILVCLLEVGPFFDKLICLFLTVLTLTMFVSAGQEDRYLPNSTKQNTVLRDYFCVLRFGEHTCYFRICALNEIHVSSQVVECRQIFLIDDQRVNERTQSSDRLWVSTLKLLGDAAHLL